MHTAIDCTGGDRKRLRDEELIRSVLTKLPRRMRIISLTTPIVLPRCFNDVKINGKLQRVPTEDLSGFVLTEEGHIAIHTEPALGSAWIDIFHSSNTLLQACLSIITDTFVFTSLQTKLIRVRSLDPADIGVRITVEQENTES